MRRFGLLWVLFLFILAPVDALPAEKAPFLENQNLTLSVDTARGARLISFFSKKQNRNLLTTDQELPLYQLDLVKDGKSVTISSREAGDVLVSFPDPSTLKIVSPHPKHHLDVICFITLPPGAEMARFSIEVVRRNTEYKIAIIRYPGYAMLLSNKQKKMEALLPVADGQRILDPLRSMENGENRGWNYPGEASAQLMAMYDEQGGIITYASDGDGHFKRLTIRRVGSGLMLPFEYIAYHLNDLRIIMPYAIEVGSFEGGWERAADIYKRWAIKQTWARVLLEERSLPEAIKRPSFFLRVNVREMAGEGKSVNRTGEIPSVVKGWREGLDLPITTLLFSWEKHGPWITPDYFPPYGGEAPFKRMVEEVRREGNQTMLYLSGLHYTLQKKPTHGAGAFKANSPDLEKAFSSAIVNPDGKVRKDGVSEDGIGERLTLCPATPMAFDTLSASLRQSLELGIDIVQVDQIVGGGVPPCFSEKHGHPPGGGTWMYQNIARILDRLTEQVRRDHPGAAISLEESGELYIPHVDIFHTGEYVQRFWPRAGKGVVGVPLFSYLYHEYALGFGGGTAPLATGEENLSAALYAQGMNLITGKMPAGAAWMKLIPFSTLNPMLQKFIRDGAGLLKSEAGKYLLYGKIFHLEGLQGLEQQIGFRSISGEHYDFPAPKLLASGFQLKNGSRGLLYINLTDEPLRVPLRFGLNHLPEKGISVWPTRGKTITSGEIASLPARESLFIILKQAS